MKTLKVKRRWIILMAAMTLIAVSGLAVGEPTFECDWSIISAADVAWLITATIFVLMMTPGLSFFYGGMVGAKNVISTMLQSFIAMGLISVLWVVIGFSLCFGDDIGGVIGSPLAHMTWHPEGLFCRWGVIDFAGGIVVHASSGVAALAGAIFLGSRKAETRKSEPANIPFVLLGAAMLWLGWLGYKLIDMLIPMRVSVYRGLRVKD